MFRPLPIRHRVKPVLSTSFLPFTLGHLAPRQALQDVDASDQPSHVKLLLHFFVGKSEKTVAFVTPEAAGARHSQLQEEATVLLNIC